MAGSKGELALAAQRERFVEEFLVDLNATAAVLRVGITTNRKSATVIASRMVKDPEVNAMVVERMHERSGLNQASILQELAALVFTKITDVCSWKDGEITYFDSDDITDRARAAIKSVEITELAAGVADEEGNVSSSPRRKFKIIMHDKMAALDKAARIFKMLGVGEAAIDGVTPGAGRRTVVERIERVIVEG